MARRRKDFAEGDQVTEFKHGAARGKAGGVGQSGKHDGMNDQVGVPSVLVFWPSDLQGL